MTAGLLHGGQPQGSAPLPRIIPGSAVQAGSLPLARSTRGQFAFSTFVDYLRLKQLSEPTLLANIGNDDQRTSGPLRAQ
jgi:uncharacterized protein (DUF3084 family)